MVRQVEFPDPALRVVVGAADVAVVEWLMGLVDFVTIGFKVTPEKLAWYISEKGSAWQSSPYITFNGGTLHSDSYGKKKHTAEDTWTRSVPATLNNSLIFKMKLDETSALSKESNEISQKMYHLKTQPP